MTSSGAEMGIVQWLDRQLYSDVEDHWDDELFRQRVVARLGRHSVVLDYGAGRGRVRQMNIRDLAKRVCGVDRDPGVRENPFLTESRVIDGAAIPYPSDTFDVAFANNVLEHLAAPEEVFAEIGRTLKPGGIFLFKTPNRRHYVPAIARATPHRFHEWINAVRGRACTDTFPTFYRVNTDAAVRRFANHVGLEVVSMEFLERRPEYLRFNGVAYLAGVAYERLVNRIEALAGWRVIMIGVLRKPPGTFS